VARRGAKSAVALVIASEVEAGDSRSGSLVEFGEVTWTDHGWMAQVIRSGVAICTRLFPARSAARVHWCEASMCD
jgi:hypothetical protein